VDRIAALWTSPDDTLALFNSLLIDHRGDRQGFPSQVAREILRLSVFYADLLTKAGENGDVWSHERTIAPVEELGVRAARSDVLQAAKDGDTRQLALLLKAGMPVDVRDVRQWTPLMVAAFHGREETAKFLLDCRANPRARDRAGYTPLHWAAIKGYEEVVGLLAARVDCNVQSSAGFTPLLQAAANGHAGVVRLLIAAGADPNLKTRDGWTALHKAVANSHIEIVRILLAAGASPFARHADGTTPISLAEQRDDEILKLLRAPGSGRRALQFSGSS
jgi:ankyrin repeat protein